MTRSRYFARAGVPKTNVCWSQWNVLNVNRTSNRIGMEDCSITWLCDSCTSISLYAFDCKCCKQAVLVLSRLVLVMMNFHFHYKTPGVY